MWDFLKKLNAAGTTIILTTHYLEEAEHLCRSIAIIDHGQIIQQSSMKQFLAGLDKETFVLDLGKDIDEAPVIAGLQLTLTDPHTLEVEVSKREPLNTVFSELTNLGIDVVSMRNKSNRLEELFVSLVERKR